VWGDTLEGGDTRVKAIKSDSDSDSDEQKKVARFFRKKIIISLTLLSPFPPFSLLHFPYYHTLQLPIFGLYHYGYTLLLRKNEETKPHT